MGEDILFKESIKSSFLKVKEDINLLKIELQDLKKLILSQKNEIDLLKSQTIHTPSNFENPENKAFFYTSIGNNGVLNDSQQSLNDSQQCQSMPVNAQQPPKTQNNEFLALKNLKKDLENTFNTLTDREFSVFLSLYELEKELGEVSYLDLAKRLKLSQTTIRTSINSLILKNAPVQKDRFFNKKVSLSIQNDFKSLNLYEKLIKLKQGPGKQTTLFHI